MSHKAQNTAGKLPSPANNRLLRGAIETAALTPQCLLLKFQSMFSGALKA
jgi:hypothetical protein